MLTIKPINGKMMTPQEIANVIGAIASKYPNQYDWEVSDHIVNDLHETPSCTETNSRSTSKWKEEYKNILVEICKQKYNLDLNGKPGSKNKWISYTDIGPTKAWVQPVINATKLGVNLTIQDYITKSAKSLAEDRYDAIIQHRDAIERSLQHLGVGIVWRRKCGLRGGPTQGCYVDMVWSVDSMKDHSKDWDDLSIKQARVISDFIRVLSPYLRDVK